MEGRYHFPLTEGVAAVLIIILDPSGTVGPDTTVSMRNEQTAFIEMLKTISALGPRLPTATS